MAGNALELHRGVQQIPLPAVLLVEFLQFGFVGLIVFRQDILDRRRFAGRCRDHLGDAVDVIKRDVLGAADVADGGACLHAAEGGDLGDLVAAVLLDGIANHLFALVVGVVEVEIGHCHAARVQKALKDQIVVQRIQAGDADAVCHKRAVAGAAHVPPDVAAAGKVAQIGDDQEVDIETHFVDDAQLTLFALLDLFVSGPVAVKALHAQVGQMAQVGLVGITLWDVDVGQVILVVFQVNIAHFGDKKGVVESGGGQIEQRTECVFHLPAAFEEVALIAEAHPFLVVQPRVGLHAQQYFVGSGIALFDIVNIVGDDQPQAELVGPGD